MVEGSGGGHGNGGNGNSIINVGCNGGTGVKAAPGVAVAKARTGVVDAVKVGEGVSEGVGEGVGEAVGVRNARFNGK
jgi:hypothetical protein